MKSPGQKLVVFTEHRDTLSYLETRITGLFGRQDAVVTIHGGLRRELRLHTQESFKHDPDVQVLLATDAAGEGINLQRAHLRDCLALGAHCQKSQSGLRSRGRATRRDAGIRSAIKHLRRTCGGGMPPCLLSWPE